MLEIKIAVAVITGGGSGIGLSVARYWLGQGGKVVLGDISEEALDAARRDLEGDVVTFSLRRDP
jgi:3-oxoacyl-[acyl-carrier protein] reductase